jgi:hypothetical protein
MAPTPDPVRYKRENEKLAAERAADPREVHAEMQDFEIQADGILESKKGDILSLNPLSGVTRMMLEVGHVKAVETTASNDGEAESEGDS